MKIIAPTDIVGDGAAHTLASITGNTITQCKWFQFLGISIANAAIPGRLGDANVSLDVASPVTLGRGIIIPAGGGQFCPEIALAMTMYDLTQIYYILAVGDTAQFAAGAA